ncbi:MAG: hypothetical protein DDT18_01242 [Actinobacteria bacterium]|nr:hypothetical protein [Actinomycetota bacterium]
MIKRNLLCVKQKESLDLGELLLYEPYKNILQNFLEIATKIEAKDFDPVAKVYDGLLSVPREIKEYYEALLGVTSYYQHSQGGRGRYIEKKLASAFENCSLDIRLSELPFWIEYPALHKKKGIFTLNGLTFEEKRMIRTIPWDWIGDRDESTDVGTILKNEKTIVFVELKNRVDSGGSAARREILTSQKFGIIVDYLLTNRKIYKKDNKEFSLAELLKFFQIENLELYIGILFDKGDRPATIETDKRNGFYSSSKEGFTYLKNKIMHQNIKILNEDLENLRLEISLTKPFLRIKIKALYGDEITFKLFKKQLPVSDLLLLKYDDIWLSQLIAIDERSFLLKYNKNFSTIFKNLLKRDRNLREKYNNLITSECERKELEQIIKYLLSQYSEIFDNKFVPKDKNKEIYLGDIIQFLASVES